MDYPSMEGLKKSDYMKKCQEVMLDNDYIKDEDNYAQELKRLSASYDEYRQTKKTPSVKQQQKLKDTQLSGPSNDKVQTQFSRY